MPLDVGDRLGHYDVTALIGEGGMGQVWQATDTQLGRDVALKILPDAFAADPDRLARFQREAQILASLNHPHIAAIYGIEEAEGTRALVLELVEGPTLADRISKGPIPLDDALPIAKQIAEALEAAHEAGVIHRDLKPANIKVRKDGTVKVLDFGLAKALDTTPEGDPSQSPTLTAAATQMGVIMGTAAYMSPEQARGKPVDKRADIWAFGAVLYEMLTGKRAFAGEDLSEVLAGVIKSEPAWQSLPSRMPPTLRTYLRRTLEKDPRQRVHDIADVRLALEGAFETTTDVPPTPTLQPAGWQRVVPWVAGLTTGLIITGLGVWVFVPRPNAPQINRFIVEPLPGGGVTSTPVLSPDGRTLAFTGFREGTLQVYLRAMDQGEAVPLRGTEGTMLTGFSPDGQWLLVRDVEAVGTLAADTTVKRVPLTGGLVTTLGIAQGGADWGPDDTVVLGGFSGLRLVPASGGEETVLTTVAEGELGHSWPRFLPHGRAVLFYTMTGNAPTSQVAVYDFETGRRENLFPGTSPTFIASGHLIFWRDGALWAVPFDPNRLEVRGDPVLAVDGVASNAAYAGLYSVAANGTLFYQPSNVTSANTLGWVNRQGEMVTPLVKGEGLKMSSLSPDGTRVVFSRVTETGSDDLWIMDLESGRDTKLTEVGGINWYPIWTADGTAVTFTSNREGRLQLFQRPTDLSRQTELVAPTEGRSIPGSWTPDGQTLVYRDYDQDDMDIWSLPVGSEPVPFLVTEFSERAPRLSPDGKWLVYISDHGGEGRVFVQAFPEGGQAFPVSTGPGTEASWSRDGGELFYRSGNQVWVADVEMGSGFSTGSPRVLFEAIYNLDPTGVGIPNYDVSPNGEHLLMVQGGAADEAPGHTVVLNWTEELKRLVPVD